MWKWGAAALLSAAAPFAAIGIAFACYASGRASLGPNPRMTPMAWAPGLWDEYGLMLALMLLWLGGIAALALFGRRGKWNWLQLGLPSFVFLYFAYQTLRFDYACNIF
jgi:hypothetical protein